MSIARCKVSFDSSSLDQNLRCGSDNGRKEDGTDENLAPLVGSILLAATAFGETGSEETRWTIFVANDNCPDYTWGLAEEQTRQAFADIVKAHLDEMNRTDGERTENRDRYNMAVAQEALCFIEHYPDPKEELIRRIVVVHGFQEEVDRINGINTACGESLLNPSQYSRWRCVILASIREYPADPVHPV